jgi:hypothetical protein
MSPSWHGFSAVIAYWNNPRGAVCHNDVLALYSVLEKLGYHARCTFS